MKNKTKIVIIIVVAVVAFYAFFITAFIFASNWLKSIDDSTRCDAAKEFMVADGTFVEEHGNIKTVEIDRNNKSKQINEGEVHRAFIVKTEAGQSFRVWISCKKYNDGVSSGYRYSYVSIEAIYQT